MTQQELSDKISTAEQALSRSIQALKQASERYLATFPQNVKDGLPAYADAKSNASAAYYMYATALSYILTSAEGTITQLSPILEEAIDLFPELAARCTNLLSAYEKFSTEALSPYFEKSQKIMLDNGETIVLSPLYQATNRLLQQSEEFLALLS